MGVTSDLGVRTVVGLGAFPGAHPPYPTGAPGLDRPPESADLAGRVGTVHGTLEVPAGVQAALEVALGAAGIPVIGLWARVPHYVSAMPYPEASAALIEGLCAVTGTVLDTVDAAHGRRGVAAPGGRAHRGQSRPPRDGPPARGGHRLRGGHPAGIRLGPAQRRRDRRRARAVPQRRRAAEPGAPRGAGRRRGGCGPGARPPEASTTMATIRITTITPEDQPRVARMPPRCRRRQAGPQRRVESGWIGGAGDPAGRGPRRRSSGRRGAPDRSKAGSSVTMRCSSSIDGGLGQLGQADLGTRSVSAGPVRRHGRAGPRSGCGHRRTPAGRRPSGRDR